MNIKQRLLQGGSWAFWGKMVASFAGLLSNIFLARLLTPDQLGAYFLAVSIITVILAFSQLGLQQTSVRLVAEAMSTERSGLARSAIRSILAILAVGLALGAGFIYLGGGQWVAITVFNSSRLGMIMGVLAVWMIFEGFRNILAEIFRGFHDIRLATLIGESIPKVLMFGLFTILWISRGEGQISQIVYLSLLSSVITVAVGGVLLRNLINTLDITMPSRNLKEIMKIALPLWITNITLYVLTQADIWIIGIYGSQADVAVYGASERFVTLISMPLLVVNAVVAPLITELYAHNKIEELEKTLRKVAGLAFLPSSLAFIVLAVSGRQVLGIVYGGFYQSGYWILLLLLIGQSFNVWAGSCGMALVQTGHQISMMATTIVSGLLTVGIGLVLVIDYSALGVAFAACIGMIIQNCLMLYWAKKYIGIWTFANVYYPWKNAV